MPAAFVGHGSPMNALEKNRYTNAWRELGERVPTPRAVLVVSAHWYTASTAVTAMSHPRTIHDFYGFPQELSDVRYQAPGHPKVAQEVVEEVKPAWVGLDEDSWGFDHGAWSVLVHMFPKADVPVVQLSIDALKSPEYHVDLGAKLNKLRRSGVFVLGSGNIVHNLRRLDWENQSSAYDWARRFDDAARERMINDPGSMLEMRGHADYAEAVPTPDHFIPAVYFGGLAAAAGETPKTIVDGYSMGSLSMTSYAIGL